VTHPPPFLAERVGVVDRNGSTLLVRGTEPLIGADLHFAYDEIMSAIKLDPTGYDFVDVCLIDNVGERWAFAPEVKSFGIDPDKQFPTSYWPPYLQPSYNSKAFYGSQVTTGGKSHPGRMVWWPIEGVPKGQDGHTELHWPGWNFIGLVDYLIDLFGSLKETVIYFHCMVGSDRTGAAHIGYLMKAKGMTLDQAIAASKITQAPPPRNDYMDLVQAYAKYLGR
jgi:hypothetical protein